MNIREISITKLKVYENKPCVTTQESLETLQHSIQRFGMVEPLIVSDTNRTIVEDTSIKSHKSNRIAISYVH